MPLARSGARIVFVISSGDGWRRRLRCPPLPGQIVNDRAELRIVGVARLHLRHRGAECLARRALADRPGADRVAIEPAADAIEPTGRIALPGQRMAHGAVHRREGPAAVFVG